MTTCSSTKRLTKYRAQRRRAAEAALRSSLSASLRLCAILIVAGSAQADWPFARGGAASTGATDVALPAEPAVLWEYRAEEASFEATPVVAGGLVFLGDADGVMHAVRLADGSPVWKRNLGETFLLSPAAAWGDAVAVADADGVVHCLAASDGAPRWTFDAGAEAYGGPLAYTPPGGAPLLLVPTEAGKLFALDAATGEPRWEFEIDAPLRCTPTVVGGCTLLAGCDAKLHAVDVATGKEVGSCDLGDPTGNTAAVLGGVAYFGTEAGEFHAVDASDPTAPVIKWTQRDARRGQGIRTAAAVTKDAVVYANQAKTVYALDPATGDELWTERSRAGVEASPLALGDGRVMVLTGRGRVLLLEAKTGKASWSYEAGGEFLASPAASAGRVLVANTDGVLTCFGTRSDER